MRDTDTMLGSMDLATQECEVEIDLDAMTATFESSRGSASASGECVRVLAAYALARRDENRVDGGWLTAQEIYNRWVDLGGNASSKMDRPGFERGKLRNQLTKQSVTSVKSLFERRASGARTEIRLNMPPDGISVFGQGLED